MGNNKNTKKILGIGAFVIVLIILIIASREKEKKDEAMANEIMNYMEKNGATDTKTPSLASIKFKTYNSENGSYKITYPDIFSTYEVGENKSDVTFKGENVDLFVSKKAMLQSNGKEYSTVDDILKTITNGKIISDTKVQSISQSGSKTYNTVYAIDNGQIISYTFRFPTDMFDYYNSMNDKMIEGFGFATWLDGLKKSN